MLLNENVNKQKKAQGIPVKIYSKNRSKDENQAKAQAAQAKDNKGENK